VIQDDTGIVKFVEKSHKDTTPVSSSGTGQDDLITYTPVSNSLINSGGAVKITGGGTKTNTNDNKTIVLWIGSSYVVMTTGTNTASDWKFEAILIGLADRTAQAFSVTFWDGAVITQDYKEIAEDMAGSVALEIKVTGECDHASDIITQKYMIIETL
jgi:hypothetical protein